MSTSYKSLQIAVALTGVACLALYPLAVVWPSGWIWEAGAPYQSHFFMMIVGVYATLGIFLLKAARDPQANLSLIWFTAISSLVHSAIMAVQAFSCGGQHMGHLVGDVPALLIAGIALAVLVRASGLTQPAHEQDLASQA
jgi:hypothetical protein